MRPLGDVARVQNGRLAFRVTDGNAQRSRGNFARCDAQSIQGSRVPRRISQARHRQSLPVAAGEKVIREMPRDPEVVEMLKKVSGIDPLPAR